MPITSWSLPRRCFYAELEEWDSDQETLAEMIAYFGPGWETDGPSVCLRREEG